MASCCDTTPDLCTKDAIFTVALAGNPNSGKTTIFNALTGLRQKVANYPGVTVEKKTGRAKLPDGRWIDIIDLPGTYSLISRSPDEVVAMEVLRGLREGTKTPDAVIVVVDASNLQRNLYLVSQLIELGRPLIVALNMMDVAERRGIHVSPDALARELGVPVIPIVGHKRRGIEGLKAAITKAKVAPMPNWALPEQMKEELVTVGGSLAILHSQDPLPGATVLQAPSCRSLKVCCNEGNRQLNHYQALAERLLIGDRAGDIKDLAEREPVSALLNSAVSRMSQMGIDPMQADIEAHYHWIETIAQRSIATLDELAAMGAPAPHDGTLPYETAHGKNLSDRIDAVLIHKIWGLVIFALIMTTLFVSIFWLAKPIMDGIQGSLTWLAAHATAHFNPDSPLKSLIANGIFKGVGAVVVFVPQIALLFFFLSILEDSGYLARAAFLMDRLLAKVGLHGKSFIPLLSSFACAIPGIMATRTIENRRDRLATILIAPFMSCSARLPVYTLLIGAFFATYGPIAQAGMMLGLYALGIIAAVLTAFIFKRTFLRGAPTAFILEMPSYKLPQWSQVARQVWVNSKEFLTKAGTTIFFLSVILWGLTYYGASQTQVKAMQSAGMEANAVDAYRLNHSIAGRFGHALEPAIRPLGYDWKMGVGLVGAFAAREVFVSTMGIIYSVGDISSDETTDLKQVMAADRHPDGTLVWRPLVAVSLLIWFVLAMQCMSTLAIVRRETGGWAWPLFMLFYMNALAYIVCLVVYQVGTHIFHA
jgi:ferrous iron transport protein B